MICNHVGYPLGIGPYAEKSRREELFQTWKRGLARRRLRTRYRRGTIIALIALGRSVACSRLIGQWTGFHAVTQPCGTHSSSWVGTTAHVIKQHFSTTRPCASTALTWTF